MELDDERKIPDVGAPGISEVIGNVEDAAFLPTSKADDNTIPPEELDKALLAQPWMQRKFRSWEAFSARCRAQGREPDTRTYYDQLDLTPDEIAEAEALLEAQRDVSTRDEFREFGVIRDVGGKSRVFRVRDGQLELRSQSEFKEAYNDLYDTILIPVEGEEGDGKVDAFIKKRVSAPERFLKKYAKRYDRAEFYPGVRQEHMPKDVLNRFRGWPEGYMHGADDMRFERTEGMRRVLDLNDGSITGYTPNGHMVPCNDGPYDGPEPPYDDCGMFLDHMLNNMCGGDHDKFDYLLSFMAHVLNKCTPAEVAVVLQGPQGSGKSLWMEECMKMVAPYCVTLTAPEDLLGKFNAHLEDTLLVAAEEAFFAGNKANAARLKTTVSGPTLNIERKGVDKYKAKKHLSLIMASNDAHVIDAASDERRYFILHVDAGEHNHTGDPEADAHSRQHYWGPMRAELDRGGRKALFRWLTGTYWREWARDGGFRKLGMPKTEMLRRQKMLSLKPEDQFILGLAESAEIGAERPMKEVDVDKKAVWVPVKHNAFLGRGTEARPKGLFDVVRERVPALRGAAESDLADFLRPWGFERKRSNGRTFWIAPTVGELRGKFEAKFPGHAWDDPDVTEWMDYAGSDPTITPF